MLFSQLKRICICKVSALPLLYVTLACVTVLTAQNRRIDVPLIMSVLDVDASTSFLWRSSPLCPKYISARFYVLRESAWGGTGGGQWGGIRVKKI